MCYVIVTARSLLWTLLTIVACLAMLAALPSAEWLVGYERPAPGARNATYSPSSGPLARCAWRSGADGRARCSEVAAGGLGAPSHAYPPCWKATLVLLGSGLAVCALSALMAVLAFCKQSLCRKSVFTLAGAAQAFAAILYILGLVLFPGGWGSQPAIVLCGEEAAPFFLAECTLGWAFYTAVGTMVLTLLCALLSMQAEISTSSDKNDVQTNNREGGPQAEPQTDERRPSNCGVPDPARPFPHLPLVRSTSSGSSPHPASCICWQLHEGRKRGTPIVMCSHCGYVIELPRLPPDS